MIFREHGQDLGRIEPVEIVHKDRAFTQPLAVDLSPGSLRPAGIGNGQVQAVRIHCLPVFCRMEMSQRIFVGMGCDLGIARGAGCEVHQHQIVSAGRNTRAAEPGAEQRILFVEGSPALSLAVDDQHILEQSAFLLRDLHLMRGIAVRGTQDRRDACRADPVLQVMIQQLIGRRNGDRS